MANKGNNNAYDYNLPYNYSMQNFFTKKYEPNPIKAPKDGIPLNRLFKISENLFEELKCPICYNLIWKPLECLECGKIFCEYCINESLKFKKFCPMCKMQGPFREAKSLKSFFGKVKINCANKGCKEKPNYFDYLTHLEKCDFRLYHCTNEDCQYQDTLNNIKYHSNECKFRIIKCKYCSKEIKEMNFEIHEKTECSQNIKCDKCHSTMTRGFYWSKHYSENGENIICLKAQVQYYEELYKKSKEENEKLKETQKLEISKYKKELSNIEKEKNNYKKENENLKKKIEDLKTSFKQI